MFGVAVWAHGAVFAAAAPDSLALQLHREGDAVDVVCTMISSLLRGLITHLFLEMSNVYI